MSELAAADLLLDAHGLLATLRHPHLDPFLALWPRADTPLRKADASTLPVLRWLPRPQPDVADPLSRFVSRVHDCTPHLTWTQTYGAGDFGLAFLERYGYTELAGTRGPVASETLACGLLLLGPDLHYPDHYHEAAELYVVLSGTASWCCGSEAWREQKPGAILYHPSNVPHAMRTGREPLLALYLWRGGDLRQKSLIGRPPDVNSTE